MKDAGKLYCWASEGIRDDLPVPEMLAMRNLRCPIETAESDQRAAKAVSMMLCRFASKRLVRKSAPNYVW